MGADDGTLHLATTITMSRIELTSLVLAGVGGDRVLGLCKVILSCSTPTHCSSLTLPAGLAGDLVCLVVIS